MTWPTLSSNLSLLPVPDCAGNCSLNNGFYAGLVRGLANGQTQTSREWGSGRGVVMGGGMARGGGRMQAFAGVVV